MRASLREVSILFLSAAMASMVCCATVTVSCSSIVPVAIPLGIGFFNDSRERIQNPGWRLPGQSFTTPNPLIAGRLHEVPKRQNRVRYGKMRVHQFLAK
jgi:hypothetical protein